MPKYLVLKEVFLADYHRPTGKTIHRIGEREIETPVKLQIAQYAGDSGFYLFYFDSSGREISDTYHSDIDQAMGQAKWEFGVQDNEWSEKLL